jgi:hypothetical protein
MKKFNKKNPKHKTGTTMPVRSFSIPVIGSKQESPPEEKTLKLKI